MRDDDGAKHGSVRAAALSSIFHPHMAHSITLATRRCCSRTLPAALSTRHFTASTQRHEPLDPRVSDLGPTIKDDYATIRAKYRASSPRFLPKPPQLPGLNLRRNPPQPHRPRARSPRLRRAPSNRQAPPRRPLLARHHRSPLRQQHLRDPYLRAPICINRRARRQTEP